jgi:shikimate kinase
MSVRRSSLLGVRRILLTGMSGTGKSSALAELAKRGFEVVDTDEGGWSVWSNAVGGYVWDEGRIAALLAREEGSTLFVSGTVSNQGRFYPRFDAVVLLSAPVEVLLNRITTRATNDYGKSREERDFILRHLAEVEPLLRATCTHEVDATQPLEVVVEQLVAIGQEPIRMRGGTPARAFRNDARRRSQHGRGFDCLVSAGSANEGMGRDVVACDGEVFAIRVVDTEVAR